MIRGFFCGFSVLHIFLLSTSKRIWDISKFYKKLYKGLHEKLGEKKKKGKNACQLYFASWDFFQSHIAKHLLLGVSNVLRIICTSVWVGREGASIWRVSTDICTEWWSHSSFSDKLISRWDREFLRIIDPRCISSVHFTHS